MFEYLSVAHQKVKNVDFFDTDCMYGLKFGVPLTAMPLNLSFFVFKMLDRCRNVFSNCISTFLRQP